MWVYKIYHLGWFNSWKKTPLCYDDRAVFSLLPTLVTKKACALSKLKNIIRDPLHELKKKNLAPLNASKNWKKSFFVCGVQSPKSGLQAHEKIWVSVIRWGEAEFDINGFDQLLVLGHTTVTVRPGFIMLSWLSCWALSIGLKTWNWVYDISLKQSLWTLFF